MSTFRPPIMTVPPISPFRRDILLRLRWNIFGSLDDIQIEDGVDENGAERRKDFWSDPVAAESIAQPALSRLSVHSCDMSEYYTTCLMELDDAPHDEPLRICNEDGRPIDARQFVTEVHAYLNNHERRKTILWFRKTLPRMYRSTGSEYHPYYRDDPNNPDLDSSDDAGFYFREVLGDVYKGDALLSVMTYATGDLGISTEAFWKLQRKLVVSEKDRRNADARAGLHKM